MAYPHKGRQQYFSNRKLELCIKLAYSPGASGHHRDPRRRRARQIAERLMETMEAEGELPPILQLAFRQNPRAAEQWKRMSPSHRRAHLFGIFYYRTPEARAARIVKCVEELLQRAGKAGADKDQDWH
jgi:hypothetical protein